MDPGPPPPPPAASAASSSSSSSAGAGKAAVDGVDFSREDPVTLFELLEKRGRGSYGTVYKVKTRDCGQRPSERTRERERESERERTRERAREGRGSIGRGEGRERGSGERRKRDAPVETRTLLSRTPLCGPLSHVEQPHAAHCVVLSLLSSLSSSSPSSLFVSLRALSFSLRSLFAHAPLSLRFVVLSCRALFPCPLSSLALVRALPWCLPLPSLLARPIRPSPAF